MNNLKKHRNKKNKYIQPLKRGKKCKNYYLFT